MTAPCHRLPLDQAAPGMTLAEPLYDAAGTVLLPQGATLTAAVLSALARRGIEDLPIDMPPTDGDGAQQSPDAERDALHAQAQERAREQARERIAQLFRRCGEQGAAGTLKQAIMNLRMDDPT